MYLGIFGRVAGGKGGGQGPREVLGGTGFHRIRAEERSAEIGYWIRPDRHREGLATEAVGALVTSGFRTRGFRRLSIGCDGANVASRRVAERLGFRREAHEVGSRWSDERGWTDHLSFAVLGEEWDGARRLGPAAVPSPSPPAGPDVGRGDPGRAGPARSGPSGGAKAYAATDPRVAPYVEALVLPEDEVLREIRERSRAAGLPDIAVGAMDGRHLEVLARAVEARRVVEIGTLGGYSTVCLARALPPDGVLHTFEVEPRHAEVAAASIRRAGVADRVRIHVGPAAERLRDVVAAGPFDLVFVDADKEGYPGYLEWAERNLRVGGLLLADNVFRVPRGRSSAAAVHAFNLRLARTGPWRATFLPIEDGLAVAVKVR